MDQEFRYLEIYRNSLSDEAEIEDVEELIRYYENNREGLLPYQSQELELPDPPEGLEYRNMGTMENHVWSVNGEILMSAKTPKKDGKGYQYPAVGHVVGLEGKIQRESDCCTWLDIRNQKKDCLNKKDKSERKLPMIT